MRLKVSKQELITKVQDNAFYAVESAFNRNYNAEYDQYGNRITFSLNSVIREAILAAVTATVETIVENQYTDDDFEKDIGLDSSNYDPT